MQRDRQTQKMSEEKGEEVQLLLQPYPSPHQTPPSRNLCVVSALEARHSGIFLCTQTMGLTVSLGNGSPSV